ncbi:oligosaccharide flippase family protein [Nocardioides sp.]|uniref:oligosaccharide flippase family protein n=1 Tax=Nocardioides sp. TaxID=35761 RepID=UPI0037846867
MTAERTASHTGDLVEVLEEPHWTVGDRLAAFTALLPPEPSGTVVLMVGDDLARHLLTVYPDALVLSEQPSQRDEVAWPTGSRVVRWDGERPPVPAGSAALVIADTRTRDVGTAARLVAPDGVLARIGPEGPYRIYPTLEHPELLWRRGWPVEVPAGPVPWLRRSLGLRIGRGAAVPHLRVDGPGASLVDGVLQDVDAATGGRGRLVGLVTGGHVVLRVRHDDGDLAVRLSVTDVDRLVDVSSRVLADVPAAAPYLPVVVAEGRTAGRPWLVSRWVPGRRRGAWPWVPAARRWEAAEQLAEVLSGQVVGQTAPGWADGWVGGAHVLPADVRARWAAELAVLDRAVPTTWCHGDLWPGNVLVDGPRATVIDWDNASDDAPQGLDLVLLRAMRAVEGSDRPVSAALMDLAVDPAPLAAVTVAGRAWGEHDRGDRVALALAAVVLYLRNRSLHDLGHAELDRHLDAVSRVLAGGPVDPEPDPLAGIDPEAGRTARGALWLATNGVVVKASQTVVLLTLAAMLAPSALGLVALGTLVANVSAIVSSLGTASALVYWRGDVHRAARTAVTIGVLTGGLLTAALWIAAPALAAMLNAEDGGATVIRGLTVTLPCLAVAAVTNELLRRRLAFARRIIPDTVSSVVGAVVAVALALGGHGVMALVVGQVVQAVLTMLLAWVVHPPVAPGWNLDDARGLLSYGGPYAGANLLELVQLNVDYLIVSWVLGAEALGQYSLAFRLAFMPYLMIVVVTAGAAFPYLCRQRGTDLGRAAVTVMGATLTLVAPICLGIGLFADDLVLLGDKWSPGVPVVAWLAAYAVLLSVGQLVQTALNAAGRPTLSMLLRLCHLLLLVVTLLVAVHHGITAVAVGQVLAATAVSLLALTVARLHVPGFSLRRLAGSLRAAAVATLAMTVTVLVLRPVLEPEPPSLVGLVVAGTAGLVAYLATVWVVDRERLRDAARLVRRAP